MSENLKVLQEKMYSWIFSFEKAIVKRFGRNGLTKNIIDSACQFEVVDWTNRLIKLGIIEKSNEKQFSSVKESINHHVDNLVLAGTWNADNRPIIEEDDNEHREVVYVKIPVCDYREPCEHGLNSHNYNKNTFPCQRLGTFLGATKMYVKEDVMSVEEQKKLVYKMTRVHHDYGCEGIIYTEDGFADHTLEIHHVKNDDNLE